MPAHATNMNGDVLQVSRSNVSFGHEVCMAPAPWARPKWAYLLLRCCLNV
jgi:hypothetical protein